MAFESELVFEDWRPAVIVPLCKGKGERTEFNNYRHYRVKLGLKNI